MKCLNRCTSRRPSTKSERVSELRIPERFCGRPTGVSGATADDHVKELLSHKLISKNRSGVSFRLNVTPTFHQLFKLCGDKKDLDVLVESELGLEKEQRQQALKAPLEALPNSLGVDLDDLDTRLP